MNVGYLSKSGLFILTFIILMVMNENIIIQIQIISYYLDSLFSLIDIHIFDNDADESVCNFRTLNNFIKLGSFYGIPCYYEKKGYLSPKIKANAILSIATHCDISRLSSAKKIAINFNGPVSISVYIDSLNVKIENKNVCNKIREYFDDIHNKYDIYVSILYPDYSSSYYASLGLLQKQVSLVSKYPFNAMRNLATFQVKTEYVSMFDVDFFYMSKAINSININCLYEYDPILIPFDNTNNTNPKLWIIPAFQWRSYEFERKYKNKNKYLLTKTELIKLIELKIISPFDFDEWKWGHICTDYDKWYNISIANNGTNNYHIKYCNPYYEPYAILKTEYSQKYKWDNDYIGRGLDDVQHIAFLAYNCFEFQVISNMFIIHEYKQLKSHNHYTQSTNLDIMYNKYVHQFANVYCNNNSSLCVMNMDNKMCEPMLIKDKIYNLLKLDRMGNTKWNNYLSLLMEIHHTIGVISTLQTLDDKTLKYRLEIKSKETRTAILNAIKQL
eukprot:410754_1